MIIQSNKTLILNEIKSHYGFVTNQDFARFLGINSNTLSNWYARNSFDYEIIYTKCVDIDGNFLFTGDRKNLRREKSDRLGFLEEETPVYSRSEDKDILIQDLTNKIVQLQQDIIELYKSMKQSDGGVATQTRKTGHVHDRVGSEQGELTTKKG